MNLKQLIKFGLEESSVPIIKNPILRAALEPRSTVQEPRNMKLAKASPWDYTSNVNNPGLEQTEVLRPGETLEEWEPNPFLKPHADGGRIGFRYGSSAFDIHTKKGAAFKAYKDYKKSYYNSRQRNPIITFREFLPIYAKENYADGGSAGQLVTPNVDGSRPGYNGLPAFVQQNRSKKNPYRVRVKPNEKLGREGFEGKFSSLKKATAKAAEFSDVVTETRNKRYTTLKELVIESNKGSKHVSMKALAEKVGIPSRDQNFTKQLKNFNIPKLDTAADKAQKEFLKIIKNPDLPIEEVFSLVKKVSNKTGLGRSKVSHHLLKLPEYKEASKMLKTLAQAEFQKKIADKGFTLGDFQEIVEQKKNVPKLQVSNISTPEKFIIDSAMRHEQQGGNKIKFIKRLGDIDKKGNLITHRDAEFVYKGKRHSYFSLLKDGRKLDDFKEVYKVADEMNDLLGREVVHPKTKEKVLFKDLMKESYNKGAGYTYTRAPYDIDHFKSVKGEPFKNLRVIPRRINTSEGILSNLAESAEKGFLPQAAELYSPEKVKAYRKKMGYEFTKDINKLFADELKLADDILIKGRVLKKPLDIAKETFNIKPKQFTLGSFPANIDENGLSKFGKSKLGKGIKLFAKGEGLFAPLFLYGGAAYGLPFTRNINEASYGILGKSKSEYLINKSPKAKKVIDLLDAEAKYNTLLENYNNGSAMDKMWFKDKMLAKQKEFEEKVEAFNAIPEEEKMELGQAYQTAEQNYEDEIKQRRDRHFSNYIIPKKEFFTDIGSNISDAFTAPVSAAENVFGTSIPTGKVQTEFANGGIANLTRTVARDSEGIMSLKK